MAYKGQRITNPVSGETITFKRTSASTGGRLLEIELELTPDGKVPGMHVHPSQEERFEVLEGKMKFRMGMKTIVAEPGDVVTVPAGKAHKFSNAGDVPARANVQVRPALKMEELFETTVKLAEEGRVMSSGMPKPLDLALFVREFAAEVRAPFSPGRRLASSVRPPASTGRPGEVPAACRLPGGGRAGGDGRPVDRADATGCGGGGQQPDGGRRGASPARTRAGTTRVRGRQSG